MGWLRELLSSWRLAEKALTEMLVGRVPDICEYQIFGSDMIYHCGNTDASGRLCADCADRVRRHEQRTNPENYA